MRHQIIMTPGRLVVAAAPLLFTLGCSFQPPPAVPVGPPVPISFEVPSASSPHQLRVSGPGRPDQSCELPCNLVAPSGSAVVTVSGPRMAVMPAVIPAEPSHAEVRFQRRGQAIAGWILAIAGTTAGSIALAATRNSGPDGQLKGGIAGVVGGGVGLVGVIVALTSGKDELRFTPSPSAATAAGAPR